MLTSDDVVFMRDAQDDIYRLRQRPVTLVYVDKQVDEITGLVIGEAERQIDVEAVITEISTRKSDGSLTMEDGVVYEQGDIKIDVKINDLGDAFDKVTQAVYEGRRYELLGGDKKGIGLRNRIEYLGREIA